MKFRKKPAVVEARRVTAETLTEVATWCSGTIENGRILLNTLEGNQWACGGYPVD